MDPTTQRILELARGAAKAAFRKSMDAATKMANIWALLAQHETDPAKRQVYETATTEWQNLAKVAYDRMNEL